MNDTNNQATQKLSPFKSLTGEQKKLLNKILSFIKKHINKDYPAIFTIYGDAGTGKSVVLSALFNKIQEANRCHKGVLSNSNNYFLVNHPEILKVYKQIAGSVKTLYKKDYMRDRKSVV